MPGPTFLFIKLWFSLHWNLYKSSTNEEEQVGSRPEGILPDVLCKATHHSLAEQHFAKNLILPPAGPEQPSLGHPGLRCKIEIGNVSGDLPQRLQVMEMNPNDYLKPHYSGETPEGIAIFSAFLSSLDSQGNRNSHILTQPGVCEELPWCRNRMPGSLVDSFTDIHWCSDFCFPQHLAHVLKPNIIFPMLHAICDNTELSGPAKS